MHWLGGWSGAETDHAAALCPHNDPRQKHARTRSASAGWPALHPQNIVVRRQCNSKALIADSDQSVTCLARRLGVENFTSDFFTTHCNSYDEVCHLHVCGLATGDPQSALACCWLVLPVRRILRQSVAMRL